jgi:uncharacterized protein YcbX
MKLIQIFVYPIKGLAGISLDSAIVETEGLQHDRRYMLIDENGKFISQREHAILCKFKTSLSEESIVVEYADDNLNIPLDDIEEDTCAVQVWDSNLLAYEVSKASSEWFSSKLDQEVRLVKMGELSTRIKDFKKAPFSSNVSFADGYPFLVLGTASMQELNDRTGGTFEVERFRPNMVVETSVAHEEDVWGDFKFGSAVFRTIKRCARCIVPTIDPETAKKGKEPIATLSQYRKEGNLIYFGSNVIAAKLGKIKVGGIISHA